MFPDRFRVGSRSLSVCFLSVHSRNSSPGLQTGLLFSHISGYGYVRGTGFPDRIEATMLGGDKQIGFQRRLNYKIFPCLPKKKH